MCMCVYMHYTGEWGHAWVCVHMGARVPVCAYTCAYMLEPECAHACEHNGVHSHLALSPPHALTSTCYSCFSHSRGRGLTGRKWRRATVPDAGRQGIQGHGVAPVYLVLGDLGTAWR